MVGGSRLGPAVLPCQHARRLRAGGRRRELRDGRAGGLPGAVPGPQLSSRWEDPGGQERLGRVMRRRGRERASGGLRTDWHSHDPGPRHVLGALAAAQRLPGPAPRLLASPRGSLYAAGARARPDSAACSARPRTTHWDSGCEPAREGGTLSSGGPRKHRHTDTQSVI